MITGLNLKALVANHSFFLFTEYFISTTIFYILIVIVLILYSAYGLLLQKSLSECIFIILIMCCYLILNDDLFALNNIHLNNFIAGDSLGSYAKVLICFFAALYFLMISTTLKEQKLTSFEYLLIILFAVLGLVLLCSSNDFLTVYLSIELSSLSLYILASFKKNSNYSIESGLKYFITGALSSAFFLIGCSFIYLFYGCLNFNDLFYFFEPIGKSVAIVEYLNNDYSFFFDKYQTEILRHFIIIDSPDEILLWLSNYLDALNLSKIDCNYTEFFFLYHLLITKQDAFIMMWVNMHANNYIDIENAFNNAQFEFFEYIIYDDRKNFLLLNLWIHVLHENEIIYELNDNFSTHFNTTNLFFIKHLLKNNNLVAYTLWKTGFLQTIIPFELISHVIRIALENNLKEIVQKNLTLKHEWCNCVVPLNDNDSSINTCRNLIKRYENCLKTISLPTSEKVDCQNFIKSSLAKEIANQASFKESCEIEAIPLINCKKSLNMLEQLLYTPFFESVPLVCSESQFNLLNYAVALNDWTAIVLMLKSIFFCNLKPSEISIENNLFDLLLSFYSGKAVGSIIVWFEWLVNLSKTYVVSSLDDHTIFAKILSNQKQIIKKKALILQKCFHLKEMEITSSSKYYIWHWVYTETLRWEHIALEFKKACPECCPDEVRRVAPYQLFQYRGYKSVTVNTELINLNLIEIGLSLILISFFIKLACAPFHAWSLDVYQGSPTNSSFFFAVITKLSIFVVLIRLFCLNITTFSYNFHYYCFCTGILSVFVGSFGGLKEKKLKTLMAYSSITNMGYGLLSLGTGTSIGIQSLFVHLIIYMLSGLCVWSILIFLQLKNKASTHKHIKELSHIALLKKSNSALAFGLSIIIFSIAGIPPLVGFLAKIGIFLSMLQQYYLYFVALSAVLSVTATFYYIRIVKILYFENLVIGKLYYPLSTSRTLVLSILIISLLILFLNPSILYLFSYTIIPQSLIIRN